MAPAKKSKTKAAATKKAKAKKAKAKKAKAKKAKAKKAKAKKAKPKKAKPKKAATKKAKTKKAKTKKAKTKKAKTKKAKTKKAKTKKVKPDGATDWRKLRHGGGSARLVPNLVARACAGGEAGIEAIERLEDALLSRPALFSASAPTLAVLVDGCRHGAALASDMLHLARDILLLCDAKLPYEIGLDLSSKELSGRYAAAEGRQLLQAAEAAVPALATLLDADDAATGWVAADMLGMIPAAANTAVAALLQRAASAANRQLRAHCLLAAMHLAMVVPAEAPALSAAAQQLVAGEDDPLVRGAAAVAGWMVDGVAATDDAVTTLAQYLVAARGRPRSSHTLDVRALRALGGPRGGDEGRELAGHAIVEALRALPAGHEPPRQPWSRMMLDWFVPTRDGGDESLVVDPWRPESAGEHETKWLAALNAVPHDSGGYQFRGLPHDIHWRRRILGLEPATVLEEMVTCEKVSDEPVPLWRVIQYGLEEDDDTEDSQQYLQDHGYAELAPSQWLEVWTVFKASQHDVFDPRGELWTRAIRAVSADERAAWRQRYTAACCSPLDPSLRDRIGSGLMLSLLDELPEGAEFPATYDKIISVAAKLDVLRGALERIPEPRRSALVRARLAMAPERSWWTIKYIIDYVIDLVPEVTTFILDRFSGGDVAWADKRFAKARERVAVVDAIYEQWRQGAERSAKAKEHAAAKASEGAGTAAPPPDVTFENQREPDDVDELSALEKKQLAAAGRLWDGNDWPAKRRLHEVEVPEEGNFFGEGLEIWDVYVEGEHLYDAWMYMVDSGVLFERGTTEVALSRIQFDFAAGGGDPLLASLVEAAYEEVSG